MKASYSEETETGQLICTGVEMGFIVRALLKCVHDETIPENFKTQMNKMAKTISNEM